MVLGILTGLLAASFQAAAYIFSRQFMVRFHKSSPYLLAISHIIMGVISMAALAFLWLNDMPDFRAFGWPLVGATLFYFAGQAFLLLAIQKTEASRVSPLLGLKILILALISFFIMQHPLTGLQWLAVAISVFAAIMLNWTGGRIPPWSLVFVLLACLGYSLSDIHIKMLVSNFQQAGIVRASLLAVALSYALSGLVSITLLPLLKGISKPMWRAAIPYSLSWLAGMVFLFGCFGLIGVVLGNIVQSSRGILSILFGVALAYAGHQHLESKVAAGVFWRRFAAAALMITAVVLYTLK